MVKIFLSLSREHLSLAMQGHAGAGENGSDLVCAACSILAHTLFKMVADAAKKGMLYAPPLTHIASGKALISCAPRRDFCEEMLHAYYMAQIGFDLLQREYPDCVELVVVEM